MANTEEMLKTLMAAIAGLECSFSKINDVKDTITNMEKNFSNSLSDISKDNAAIRKEVLTASEKLKILTGKFDENECNWKRAGDTFESKRRG